MKKWIVAIVAVLGIGAAFWLTRDRGDKKAQTIALATRSEAPLPRARYFATRPPIDDKMRAVAEVTPECLAYWNKLRTADMSDLFRKNDFRNVPIPKGECVAVPERLRESHQKFQEYCGAFLRTDEKQVNPRDFELSKKGCEVTMGVYRAQITEWLTRDTPLDQISDPRILADKTLARYYVSPKKSAEAAERLLEVEPDNYSAAKMSLMGRMVDARKGGADIDDKSYALLKERLKVAREIGPEDKNHLMEIEYAIDAARTKDPAKLRAKADQIAKENPESGLGYYLAACAARKAGNNAEAMALMEKAAKTEPNEFRYSQSLRLMQAERAGFQYGVCGAQLDVPPDLLMPSS